MQLHQGLAAEEEEEEAGTPMAGGEEEVGHLPTVSRLSAQTHHHLCDPADNAVCSAVNKACAADYQSLPAVGMADLCFTHIVCICL